MIFDRELNPSERANIEGYLAHKWRSPEQLLSSGHPHLAVNPYGGVTKVTDIVTEGGDPLYSKSFGETIGLRRIRLPSMRTTLPNGTM